MFLTLHISDWFRPAGLELEAPKLISAWSFKLTKLRRNDTKRTSILLTRTCNLKLREDNIVNQKNYLLVIYQSRKCTSSWSKKLNPVVVFGIAKLILQWVGSALVTGSCSLPRIPQNSKVSGAVLSNNSTNGKAKKNFREAEF